MTFATLSQEEFLYICKIISGVDDHNLFKFRALIFCGMIQIETDLDQRRLSRKLQELSEMEMANLYAKVLESASDGSQTGDRLQEIAL